MALPKSHWVDAACVGKSTPLRLTGGALVPLLIRATGRQSRQMCRMDKYGFVRREVAHVIALHGNAAAIEPVVPSTVP
jgi:hypothetical protein